jgi:hypothetical protein
MTNARYGMDAGGRLSELGRSNGIHAVDYLIFHLCYVKLRLT